MTSDSLHSSQDAEDAWRKEHYAFPASFGQRRLWFIEQLEPGRPTYNMPAPFRLVGPLDTTALERSLNVLIERHEALRTRFGQDELGEPIQEVASTLCLPLPVIDLHAVNAQERKQRAHEILDEWSYRPFVLERGPLVRWLLLRMDEDEHILLVVVHHAIGDAVSIGIFWRELIELYQARGGDESILTELPLQYADFAHWQREQLRTGQLDEQLAYWRRQLKRFTRAPSLPVDYPRASGRRRHHGQVHLFLSDDIERGLRALCVSTGSTLFIALLTAFEILLHRYTGLQQLVVGTALSHRDRYEFENVIGFFVNMLPICVDLTGEPTYLELLRRVRETTLEAFANRDVPFEKLVEDIAPERESTKIPLFQAVFSFNRREHFDSWHMADLTVHPFELQYGPAKFNLILDAEERDQQLMLAVGYDTSLYRADTIERMLEHYHLLLRQIVAEPATRLGEFAVLSPQERELVLGEWNATDNDFPRTASLGELFTARCQRYMERIALVQGERILDYAALERQSNRLAHGLLALGVKRGDRVAVYRARSVELVVALLAIVKAGAAYVPLDPSYPEQRLRAMVVDAGCKLLLGDSEQAQCFAPSNVRVVDMESELAELASAAQVDRDTAPTMAVGGRDLAYVIYTSGSTGRPKGVMVEHRAVLRLICSGGYAPLTSEDTVAHLSNVSFDAATWELWAALLAGSSVVIVERDDVLSPELGRLLTERGVTAAFLTTALFNRLIDENPRSYAGLRHILFGGEAVDPVRVRRVMQSVPPERLVHVYGPTESTTFATWHRVRDVPDEATTVPIGRPLDNTYCYVLDSHLRPTPIGMPGELYIGGEGLARGYHTQPGQTASRFVPDPFSRHTGQRMYRTGDIVRQEPDGAISFVGRLDDQVKIRGFRIEPGEIESALQRHPRISNAGVVVRKHASGDQLIAFVACDVELSESAVREFLRARFPAYMIPLRIILDTDLPLTPNGKLDRHVLAERVQTTNVVHVDERVAPHNERERQLCAIFADVLDLPTVGIDDDFFHIGGHSLLALRLTGEIRRVLGITVPPATLFAGSTVRRLAELLAQNRVMASVITAIVESDQPSGPVVHWVHPVGGNVLCYAELARHLSPGYSCYGIQSESLLVDVEPIDNLPQLARRYVDILLSSQTYTDGRTAIRHVLGGWSLGGLVAFEMACQLRESGHPVDSIVLLDTAEPSYYHTYAGYSEIDILDFFLQDFLRLANQTARHLSASWQGRQFSACLDEAFDIARSQIPGISVIERAEWQRFYRVFRANLMAAGTYVPQRKFSGRIVLIRARESADAVEPGAWHELAHELTDITLPGDHYSLLMPPHASTVADRMLTAFANNSMNTLRGIS